MLSNIVVGNTTKVHKNINKLFLISLYNSNFSEFIDSVLLSLSIYGKCLAIFHCDQFLEVEGLCHRRYT